MSRRIQIIFICLAAGLLLGQPAAADVPFDVTAWSTADGLPQSSVIALTQTRDGWLWLGTLNGLARFDGDAFTPFNVNNTPGLPSDRIVFLFEDSHANLWVGTDDGGLCVLRNGVVEKISTGGSAKIIYAYEDENHEVWFCSRDGKVLRWRNRQMDLEPPVTRLFWEQLFRRAFNLVVQQKDGGFWHLNSETACAEIWRNDRLQTNFGPVPWTASIVSVVSPGMFMDRSVTATCTDRDGNLVVGTAGDGIFWSDKQGNWRHVVLGKKTSENYVLSVFFDREDNLWAGTDGGGLYRVRKKNYLALENLPAGTVKSVAQDANGGLWVTYNAHGLAYTLTNSAEIFGIGRSSNAWSVLVDRNQNVWAGTSSEGLFRLTDGAFQPVIPAAGIGLQIFAQFETRDGKVWFGSQNGLASFDGTDWRIFSTTDGLPSNPVRALAEDANTNLFIGTDGGGIFSMNAGKLSPVNAPVKDVSCLFVDRDGILWAGTSGHGLARFAAGQWTTFSAADGLAGDDIGYLIDDDLGNLWLGTYEGLVRVDKKSLADFANGTVKKISCRTFLTRECSAGAQPAAMRASDGTLLFPTIEGVVTVNPADLAHNTNPPPVVIESVLVDGAPVKGDAVTLTPENEQLEIHFTALNFSAPKGAQFGAHFKYQLEGRDNKPTDIGGERVAHFSRLAPGDYTFRVTACNEDGVWNEAGATLSVTVQPPFWRKPGFIAACVLIFIGALAGIIYLISTAQLKRQLRTARQKEIIEHERARIARDLHDQLGANLTQITLLGEMVELDKAEPGEVEQHAQQICETARETTRALDEIVWAVNPSNDTLEGLTNYACKYAQDYFALAGISYRAELPADLPPMPILPEVRHNVFLAFKEAVNNVVKHAQASEARVKLQLEADQFILSVTDNGRGLGDLSSKSLRNGLKNMRKRLDDVRGQFEIVAGENGGTIARFTVPLKK
ncbi:MAG TPA: two-component regulator propeller domain-containing protein [Candidatus Sulfotelmatobacter sp.]|nr:two-component regulator propeller domain-containing protein [Candidatus Sulfotelmatobacter sp.]